MSKPHARRSREGDAEALAPVLRPDDLREIAAASGRAPLAVLRDGLKVSAVCRTIVGTSREPIAMLGIVPISPGLGAVWMLASEAIEQPGVGMKFARQCRKGVARLLRHTPVLINFVDARSARTIRWLKWVGAEFQDAPVPYGVEGRPFFMFKFRG